MNRNWLEKDFYGMLEVDKDADQPTIKKAYRRLAQKLHPDANPDNPNSTERFKEVSEAYSVLSDPERREEYDQVRSLGPQGFGGFGSGAGGGYGGGSVRIEDLLPIKGFFRSPIPAGSAEVAAETSRPPVAGVEDRGRKAGPAP